MNNAASPDRSEVGIRLMAAVCDALLKFLRRFHPHDT